MGPVIVNTSAAPMPYISLSINNGIKVGMIIDNMGVLIRARPIAKPRNWPKRTAMSPPGIPKNAATSGGNDNSRPALP